jgi:hypothetical protein
VYINTVNTILLVRSIHKYFHRHITEGTLWKFADRFGKINVFDTAYLGGIQNIIELYKLMDLQNRKRWRFVYENRLFLTLAMLYGAFRPRNNPAGK